MNKLEKEVNKINLLGKIERIIFIITGISMTLLCLSLIIVIKLSFI